MSRPLPVVRRRGLAAGGWMPGSLQSRGAPSSSPACDPSWRGTVAGGRRRAEAGNGGRESRLVGLRSKRRAVGPARGRWGRANEGSF